MFVFHLRPILDLPGSGVGYVGVAFFFVLSGFVLTWSTGVAPVRPGHFWWRRVARIWPAHLVVLVVAVALPGKATNSDGWDLLASSLLVQAWVPAESTLFAGNGVAWSLSCEVFFYALFPVLLFLARRWSVKTFVAITIGAWVIASTFTVLVAAWQADLSHGWFLAALTFPLIRLPEFMLGIAAAECVRAGWRPSRTAWIATAGLTVAGLAIVEAEPAADGWAAPLFTIVVAAAASWDRAGRPTPPRWLVYAGEASFAFYLAQGLVVDHGHHLLGSGWLVALAALAISWMAACALHHGIERPARRWLVGWPRP